MFVTREIVLILNSEFVFGFENLNLIWRVFCAVVGSFSCILVLCCFSSSFPVEH